jgi:hypothetical protein
VRPQRHHVGPRSGRDVSLASLGRQPTLAKPAFQSGAEARARAPAGDDADRPLAQDLLPPPVDQCRQTVAEPDEKREMNEERGDPPRKAAMRRGRAGPPAHCGRLC